MLIFHAGARRHSALGKPVQHRVVHLDLAEHLAQLLHGHAAGTQHTRCFCRQSDDGALYADRAGAAVQHRVDPAVHVIEHMPRRGGAG